MRELIQQLDSLENRMGKLEVLESGASGGVASVAVTSPITNSGTPTAPNIGLATSGVSAGSYTNGSFTVLADGRITAASSGAAPVTSVGATSPIASSGGATPTISIAITTANDGGAVAKQAGTGLPGTSQAGSSRLTGSVAADTAFYRAGIAMNNIIVLDKVCRVLDDATSRASGYANSAVAVAGATDLASGWVTLPATLKACWYTVFVLTAAATGVGFVVENPSFIVGASTMRGTTVQQAGGGNFAYSGNSVVSLNASGQLRFVYAGTANSTRIIIDIWAYSS